LAAADRCAHSRRALFYVLTYTGCRLSEALALTRDQLDEDALTLTFRTLKRRRVAYRSVPVPTELVAMLSHMPLTADRRFWSAHRSAAWRWTKLVMKQAAIAGPMASPKGLRHGYGVLAVLKGISLPIIQRWMGHARPTTTAIYLQVVDDEERQLAARMW
jgi:integrase/recombinase XerD